MGYFLSKSRPYFEITIKMKKQSFSWDGDELQCVQSWMVVKASLNLFQLKGVNEGKLYVFDADHERRRKEQLKRLYERTPEQVYSYYIEI